MKQETCFEIWMGRLKHFDLSNDAHFDVVENDIARLQLFEKSVGVEGAGLQRFDDGHVWRGGRFNVGIVVVVDRRHGRRLVVGSVGDRRHGRGTLLALANVLELATLLRQLLGQDGPGDHSIEKSLGAEKEEVLDLLSHPEIRGQDQNLLVRKFITNLKSKFSYIATRRDEQRIASLAL